MTTTKQPKASISTAVRQLKARLAEFKADDPPKYRGFRVNAIMAGLCFLVGYVLVTRTFGWVMLLAGGVVACFAIFDVHAWRIGQLRKRLDALQGQMGARDGQAPPAASNVAPGAAKAVLEAPDVAPVQDQVVSA